MCASGQISSADEVSMVPLNYKLPDVCKGQKTILQFCGRYCTWPHLRIDLRPIGTIAKSLPAKHTQQCESVAMSPLSHYALCIALRLRSGANVPWETARKEVNTDMLLHLNADAFSIL